MIIALNQLNFVPLLCVYQLKIPPGFPLHDPYQSQPFPRVQRIKSNIENCMYKPSERYQRQLYPLHHEESGIETRRYSCSFSITQLSKPARDRLWSMLKTLARTQGMTVFSVCYFLSFLALLARAQGVYLNEHF